MARSQYQRLGSSHLPASPGPSFPPSLTRPLLGTPTSKAPPRAGASIGASMAATPVGSPPFSPYSVKPLVAPEEREAAAALSRKVESELAAVEAALIKAVLEQPEGPTTPTKRADGHRATEPPLVWPSPPLPMNTWGTAPPPRAAAPSAAAAAAAAAAAVEVPPPSSRPPPRGARPISSAPVAQSHRPAARKLGSRPAPAGAGLDYGGSRSTARSRIDLGPPPSERVHAAEGELGDNPVMRLLKARIRACREHLETL